MRHLVAFLLLSWNSALAANPIDPALRDAALAVDVEAVRARGPSALPQLAELYESSAPPERAVIASVFYALGWQSRDAERVMLADLDTDHEVLRINVQWALGRVSADPQIVDRLLTVMESDPNPLFRDKAGCALASDQIHLDPRARYQLMHHLVDRLESENLETRSLAIRVLAEQTGQAKGYLAIAPPEQRTAAIARWRAWLAEYEREL